MTKRRRYSDEFMLDAIRVVKLFAVSLVLKKLNNGEFRMRNSSVAKNY